MGKFINRIVLAAAGLLFTICVSAAQPVTVIGPVTPGNIPQFNSPTIIKDSGTSASSFGGVVSPEQYGATGGANDTAAFISMCAAIRAGGIGTVQMFPGRPYNVWPTTPADQSVLCNLGATTGLRWYFNGASFNVGYTGNAITYIFEITGGNQITIDGLTGTAATGKHVSGDITGVNWVVCSNQGGSGFGCTKLAVTHASINGGFDGVAIVRTFGTGAYSHDIWVDGFFSNVGYPVSNQADGLNTAFDIVTVNAGRSYIGYNVWGVRGRINSITGAADNDVLINAYGFQGDLSQNTTANIEISYVNRKSTTYGASLLAMTHQQADPAHSNIASTISNVRFSVDVIFNGSVATELFEESVYSGNGSSQVLGDVGNTDDNIIIEGKVEGDVTGPTFLGCIMTASNGNCGGYNGTSKGTYNLSNLQIPTSTKPWAVGLGATVTFQNYASPNAAAPTFDGGYDTGQVTYRQPVLFSGIPDTEPFQGTANFYDPTGQSLAFRARNGARGQFYNTSNVAIGQIGALSGNFDILSLNNTNFVRLGFNSVLYWNVGAAGILQPISDNASAIGDATHRVSNIFGVLGTFNNVNIVDTSAPHNVVFGATSSVALTADRALTIDVVNGARTISLGGNLTTSGAFAITLTSTATTNSTLPAGTHTLAGLDVAQSWNTNLQTFNGGVTITSAFNVNTFFTVTTANLADGALKSQFQVNDTTAYNASPCAGMDLATKYTSGGTLAGGGGIAVCKLNTVDGDFSFYTALYARNNGGSVFEGVRLTNTGGFLVGMTTDTGLGSVGVILHSTSKGATITATAPGAGNSAMVFACGTNAGTAGLYAGAGTSTTYTRVLDNIGASVTGC
jgi:hypothetical protein